MSENTKFYECLKNLEYNIRANCPLLYICTQEENRIISSIKAMCSKEDKKWNLYSWDISSGLNLLSGNDNNSDYIIKDQISILEWFEQISDDPSGNRNVLILKDFQNFWGDDFNKNQSENLILRNLINQAYNNISNNKNIIIIGSTFILPQSIERLCYVIDFPLPEKYYIDEKINNIIDIAKKNNKIKNFKFDYTLKELDEISRSLQGLSLFEIDLLLAYMILTSDCFDINIINSRKKHVIKKTNIVEWVDVDENINHIGGLDILKNWLYDRKNAFTQDAIDYGLPENPKGLLLTGIQGAGKSITAKVISRFWNLPLIRLDLGRVFSGIVGSSEQNIRSVIRLTESIAPCITGDSIIVMEDKTTITIKELFDKFENKETENNIKVLSINGKLNLVSSNIKALTRRLYPSIYSIQTKNGNVIKATPNHQHLIIDNGEPKWVRTDELKINDKIAVHKDYLKKHSSTEDKIPVGIILYYAMIISDVGVSYFSNIDNTIIFNYITNKIIPSRIKLKIMCDKIEQDGLSNIYWKKIRNLINSPINWTSIEKISEMSYNDYVYDICCEDNHNFIANGFITHNCILWLDEVDKGLSGTTSSGYTDGGTTSRVFGTLLTWMQEKKYPVYIVATSNNVFNLPAEFIRKGRFDEIFFLDIPQDIERENIFEIHIKKLNRDISKFNIKELVSVSDGFTGAEIEAAIISAMYIAFSDNKREITTEDIKNVCENTIPLSITMKEQINEIKKWAKTRAKNASYDYNKIDKNIIKTKNKKIDKSEEEEL